MCFRREAELTPPRDSKESAETAHAPIVESIIVTPFAHQPLAIGALRITAPIQLELLTDFFNEIDPKRPVRVDRDDKYGVG
jgi:hypothetical protein